jgi:hypothetical protein
VTLWDNRAVADRDELIEDYREFTRGMLARFERSIRGLIAEMQAERLEMRAERLERRAERLERSRQYDSIEAKRDEILAEGRTQRQALLALIDAMRGNGPAPDAA